MAQTNIISREQAVYVGEESTFQIAPSGSFPNAMTRTIVAEPIIADGAVREMLDINDVRVRRLDAITPVQGLELASKIALAVLLKRTPNASQLVSGVSAAALTPRLMLRHGLGTEWANEGSTVATGTSSSVFDVQAGEGVRFRRGTLIAVQVTGQMEWALVTNVVTDTITVSPALSNTPATSAIVRNLYNYAPAESHTNSLTVQLAYVGDNTAQMMFNGCHGNVSFTFGEFGKLCSMGLDMTAVSYTGPSAQSFSTATAVDEMGRAFPFTPSVYFAPLAPGVSRTTTLVCEKFTIEYQNGWEMVRDPSASNTVAAVVNTAGRPRAAKVMLTLRFDSGYPSAFDNETEYRMAIVQRIGTGTTASFWIWEFPRAALVAQPKLTKVGERLYMDLEINALQATLSPTGTETADELDALYAPMRVAFG